MEPFFVAVLGNVTSNKFHRQNSSVDPKTDTSFLRDARQECRWAPASPANFFFFFDFCPLLSYLWINVLVLNQICASVFFNTRPSNSFFVIIKEKCAFGTINLKTCAEKMTFAGKCRKLSNAIPSLCSMNERRRQNSINRDNCL